MSNTRVDSLALWKIINEEDAVLIPKTFLADFCTWNFFWGGGRGLTCYATTPLIVALSPDHSDITKFRPWSTIATGNLLDRAEKIRKVAQTTDTFDVFDPRSDI